MRLLRMKTAASDWARMHYLTLSLSLLLQLLRQLLASIVCRWWRFRKSRRWSFLQQKSFAGATTLFLWLFPFRLRRGGISFALSTFCWVWSERACEIIKAHHSVVLFLICWKHTRKQNPLSAGSLWGFPFRLQLNCNTNLNTFAHYAALTFHDKQHWFTVFMFSSTKYCADKSHQTNGSPTTQSTS